MSKFVEISSIIEFFNCLSFSEYQVLGMVVGSFFTYASLSV
jgi:hypothetical protein